jgi:hypothetical protein
MYKTFLIAVNCNDKEWGIYRDISTVHPSSFSPSKYQKYFNDFVRATR